METAEKPINTGNRFTSESASLFAAKAAESRQRNKATAAAERHAAFQAAIGSTLSQYQGKRLERVRAQLDLLDKRIEEQVGRKIPDGQTLNWLAAAQARLSEQERQLSGRPMPGSLKPSVAKGSRSRSEVTTTPTESQHNSQVESQNSQVQPTAPKHDPDEPNG